jgi:hypothetical protein
MAKRTLALLGLLEALFPRRIVTLAERVTFRDRGEAELRSWIVPAARAEGLLWLLLVRRGSTPALGTLLGIAGVPALLAPRRTLDVALRLAYEESETIELASWVVPVTRVIGVVYVLAGLRSLRRRGTSTGDAKPTNEDDSA